MSKKSLCINAPIKLLWVHKEYVLCICKAEYAKQAKFSNIDVHHVLIFSESVSDTTYYENINSHFKY